MTVVLLHAFPLDERMWEPLPVWEPLPAIKGHNFMAYNLYGLGGSSIDGWAEFLLNDLRGELLPVGASLGGYVALAMARREPERIRGLLLAGSRATPDPPDRRALRDEMIRVVRAEGIEGWNREFSPPGPPDRTIDELVRGIEALRDRPDATDVLTSFTGPLVVVVGDQDDILPVDEARQIAASAPHGRLEVVEGAGHLVSVEAPERFNQILLELLTAAR